MENKESIYKYVKHLAKNVNEYEKKNLKLETEKTLLKKELTNLEIKQEFSTEKEIEIKKMLINTIKLLASDRFFILRTNNKSEFDKSICNFLQDIFFEKKMKNFNKKTNCQKKKKKIILKFN